MWREIFSFGKYSGCRRVPRWRANGFNKNQSARMLNWNNDRGRKKAATIILFW
jgi:hypothetical protein